MLSVIACHLVHESLHFIFSNTYLKMSGTVSEMFGSGRESDNDTL